MKIYNKYKIEHTDGTPLKGKKYFVLRLDSDDPIEAARVAMAMRAYYGKLRNCDVGTAEDQEARYFKLKTEFIERITKCPHVGTSSFFPDSLVWSQMPYEAEEGAGK